MSVMRDAAKGPEALETVRGPEGAMRGSRFTGENRVQIPASQLHPLNARYGCKSYRKGEIAVLFAHSAFWQYLVSITSLRLEVVRQAVTARTVAEPTDKDNRATTSQMVAA